MNVKIGQTGSGLIGILISLIVLAIGGVAISGLVGNLISGSGATKARNEALELAREKVEELRNFIEKEKFDKDFDINPVPPRSPEEIEGANVKFTRQWTINDDASINNLKKIVMQVSYVDPADPVEPDGTTPKQQKVLLNSFIAFSDPTKSGTILTGGTGDTGGAAPSTNRSAIEGPEDGTAPKPDLLNELDEVPGLEADPADRIYTSINSNGHLLVYQGEPSNNANVKLTIFGGHMIRISGVLHYSFKPHDLKDSLYVRGTSPSFCTWFPALSCDPLEEVDDLRCGYYVCYASGDCSNETEASITAPDSPSADCQWGFDDEEETEKVKKLTGDKLVKHLDNIRELNLKGGWYGKVGVFYLDNNEPGSCVVNDDNKIPARFYVSERWISDALEAFEGINSSYDGAPRDAGGNIFDPLPPYTAHNFVRVSKKQDCDSVPPDTLTHNIIRCLSGNNDNTIRGTNEYYKTASLTCPPYYD